MQSWMTKRAGMLGASLIALAGCTIFPEPPNHPVRSFVLTLEAPAANPWPACAAADGVLLVGGPREQSGTYAAGIAYLLRPHEIRYYAYNQWAENPGRLLLPLLIQALERTNCWSTVTQANSALRGDYRLDSEILHWQQEFFANPAHERLAFRAQLVDTQKREVIAAKRFEIIEQTPSGDAYGAVIASNRAVNRLLAQIGEWLKTEAPRPGG